MARRRVTLCAAVRAPTRGQVLLFAPNLVGYARLALLGVAACVGAQTQRAALVTYWVLLLSFALDGLDGVLARRLCQATAFGAFLDVAVDCFSRACVWVWAVGPAAAVPITLELLTFLCTHKAGGAAWRTGCFMDAPAWVRSIMADGFRTPPGAAAVAGLFGAPLWLWARRHLPGSAYAAAPLGAALGAGRLLAAAVEAWVVLRHARGLLDEDAGRARARGLPGDAGGAPQADGDAALGAE